MSLDENTLGAIAARMLTDYDARTPGTVYAEGFRLNIAESWRLQTAVTRLREQRGEKVVGYKVGCVSAGNQTMMAVPHPVWGRLWDSERHTDGAALRKSDYANIAIEAEFGVTFNRSITPGMSLAAIADAVDALYPLIELHQLVMRSEPPHGHELIANNCINCGVVLGAAVTDLRDGLETDLKLIYDGSIIDEWAALVWPQDILGAVDWLASNLAEHGLAINAGDLILTGAWGPPLPVNGHTLVEVTSSAFGEVRATFT